MSNLVSRNMRDCKRTKVFSLIEEGVTSVDELVTVTGSNKNAIFQWRTQYRKEHSLSEDLTYSIYMTHQEIADLTGYTRPEIKDIEQSALNKIRQYLKDNNLTELFSKARFD